MREAMRRAAVNFHEHYENPDRRASMGANYVTLGRTLYARITTLLDALEDREGELRTAREQRQRLWNFAMNWVCADHVDTTPDEVKCEDSCCNDARAALGQEGAVVGFSLSVGQPAEGGADGS